MKKGILYAILLLAMGTIVASNAFADVYITDENLTTIPLEIELTHDENYIINTTFCPADPNDVVILFDLSGPDHVSYGGKITINNWGCGSIVIGRRDYVYDSSWTPVEVWDYSDNKVTFYLGDIGGSSSPGTDIRFLGPGITSDFVEIGGVVELTDGQVTLSPDFYDIRLEETASHVDILRNIGESYIDPYFSSTYLYTCSHYYTTIIASNMHLNTANCVGGYTQGPISDAHIYYPRFMTATGNEGHIYVTQPDTNISYVWFDATRAPITLHVGNNDVRVSHSKFDGTFACSSTGGKIYIDSSNDYNNATFDSSCNGVVVFGSSSGSPSGEECVEINADPYTITQPGCYRLTADNYNTIYINVPEANGQPLVVDLNGHTLASIALSSEVDYNGPIEIYGGTLQNAYLDWAREEEVYLHDISEGGPIYVMVRQGAYLTDVNASLLSVRVDPDNTVPALRVVDSRISDVYLYSYSSMDINISGTTISRRLILPVQDSNVVLDSVVVKRPQAIIYSGNGSPARSITINNTTVDGHPLYYNNDPNTWVSDAVYLVDNIPSTAPVTVHEIVCMLCDSSTELNAPPARNVALYGVSAIYHYRGDVYTPGSVTIRRVVDFDGTIYNNVEIYDTDNRIEESNIATDVLYAYTDVNAEGSAIDASVQVYNGAKIYADVLSTTFVSVNSNDSEDYLFAPATLLAKMHNVYFYAYVAAPRFVFDGTRISRGEGSSDVELYFYGPNKSFVFRNVSVDQNVSQVKIFCRDTNQTVVFEGFTDTSKFDVTGCANVVNNTVEPNLTATSDQTYAEIAEGNILEYNVTVTSYDAPVDDVVVRATASNYYTQFNQTLEQTIPHIDANQSVTITFEFNLASAPATYTITATVDPDNTIDEANEMDNTTQEFYVNVERYDPACGTLTTGMYKLTQHLTIDASQSEPCYYVPNGETVMFLGGTGITAPTIDFKVFFVEGSLSIHGLWGRGKIYIHEGGYAYLDHVVPSTGEGWIVVNDGTVRLSRNNEIENLSQTGGTVYIDGPNTIIHSYFACDFTGTRTLQLFTDPTGVVFAYDGTSAPMYADLPISGDGAYVYLNTAPSVATQTDFITALIVADGQDGELSDMNIYYVQVGGGKGSDPSELNLTNVNIVGESRICDEPNEGTDVFSKIRMRDSTADVRTLMADSGEYYFVNTTVTADNLRFWNNSKVYLDNSSLSIGEFEPYSDDSTPVYIIADTTNGPVNIDINSFVGTDPLVIECAPNGHHFLYLSDNIFDYNTTIDQSCYPYIDYQRNLRVEIVAAPDSVNPDTNYQITARVYNDAQYTDFNGVVARLYINGAPTVEKEVNIPAGGSADISFTVHSTPEVGTQQIDIFVDPDNYIFEANEQDNSATKDIIVEVQQAPTSNPAPSVGAGGPAAIAATQAIYVSAKVGEEKETAIHVSWKYGFPTKAAITYININGKIIGPEEVELRTGDNIIPIKVIPSAYGEVGKVIIYAQNEKQEVTVYARPLAQLAIAGVDVKVLLVLIGIVLLLYLYFRK